MHELEIITLEGGDRDAWVCMCGNTPASAGFYPCDLHGNPVEPTEKDWTTNLLIVDDQLTARTFLPCDLVTILSSGTNILEVFYKADKHGMEYAYKDSNTVRE